MDDRDGLLERESENSVLTVPLDDANDDVFYLDMDIDS